MMYINIHIITHTYTELMQFLPFSLLSVLYFTYLCFIILLLQPIWLQMLFFLLYYKQPVEV